MERTKVLTNMKIILTANSEYTTRRENLEGIPYIVVPVTMMVEGVHSGSHGPLYHPAEVLGEAVDAWNGMPVTIEHPESGGELVSANFPGIIAQYGVGMVQGARMDGTALRAEAWLVESTLKEKSPEAFDSIEIGVPIEVSIGVFSDDEEISGEWNNETYNAISRGHVPDHLALLPEGVGACSWSDGCGIRANMKGGKNEMKEKEKSQLLDKEQRLTELIANAESGFREIMSTIQDKLNVMDTDVKAYYLADVYDDYFVYEVRSREGMSPPKMYKRNYSVNDSGELEFAEEPSEVRKQVTYVTFSEGGLKRTKFNNNKKEVSAMSTEKKPCCEDLVKELIANERTKFTDEDKEWLLTLEEAQLAKFIPNEVKTVEPKEEAAPQLNADEAFEIVKKSLKTNEDFLNFMPDELREQARSGLRLHQEHRAKMVKSILDNTDEGIWKEDSLKVMDIEVLEGIFKSVVKTEVVADYSLNGSMGLDLNKGGEEPMIPIFARKKEAAKTA